MKIEIGESLIRSWLRHVVGCEFAELNWKPSPTWKSDPMQAEQFYTRAKTIWPNAFGPNTLSQLIKQSEVDVIGYAARAEPPKVYLVDIAFHGGGLNYGGKEKTAERIFKKLVRAILLGKLFFPDCKVYAYFVSPFITASHNIGVQDAKAKLYQLVEYDESIEVDCFLGEAFSETILREVLMLGAEVADTSELFLRSWQLIEPFQKKLEESQSEAASTRSSLRAGAPRRSHTRIYDDAKQSLLIAALYMSRFGHSALRIVNQGDTLQELARRLNIPANTLKNQRDFFDSHVDNQRVGWKVPLSGAQQSIMDRYGESSELELRSLLPGFLDDSGHN